jgi:hypothetical protein
VLSGRGKFQKRRVVDARDAFSELFGRVAVVEVTGGVDFDGLVGVVDKLLSA